MSTGGERPEPTDEELQAAYEAQVKQIRVEHVLLENVVTLANLGMRRTGLAPGTEDERDPEQVRLAIESIRALLPMVEQTAPKQAGPIRDALSQLQLAFVRIGGSPAETGPGPGQGGGEPGGGPGGESGGGGGGESGGGGGGESGGGGAPPSREPAPGAANPGEPGPAQRSGRLWIPGQ